MAQKEVCEVDAFVITSVLNLSFVKDPKGRKVRFDNRICAGFIITVSGKIRFSYEGGELFAEKGKPIFLPKGLAYTNECLETAESYVFNFQTLENHTTPFGLSPISTEQIRAIYEQMDADFASATLFNRLSVLEQMYALARILLRDYKSEAAVHPVVAKATDYMNRQYPCSTLTVGDIAEHCYVSEVYLRKLFEREAKTSPFRKLTAIRMEKAQWFIAEKRPLKEVALSVGYADVFQFSRAYKRYFGYPPSKSQ